ncbi:hypothetical protein F0562_001500 [Nyssa sinensis]|uniref:DUF4220 domain-containing protein n=1 Tax=Nyssa sinensis TaxID=561372 RepID=A0A5J5C4C1_9ASTE|nr:hypothetical protein F0562_001500 [Nyssa sinensis]
MDLIPVWLKRLWDMWDLRMLILLSLTIQIILYIFGNRRKYMTSIGVRIIVWFAYLTADWVATVALGKLSDAMASEHIKHDSNNELLAIWAPLLLLHLGGPDTITAYSLEDNQLWLRHLLGMGVQFVVAISVILLSWRHSWFSILTFPVLVAGMIKYGERTWVLKSASDEQSQHIVPLGRIPTEMGNHLSYANAEALMLANHFLAEFRPHTSKPASSEIHRFTSTGRPVAGFLGFDMYVKDGSKYWKAFEIEMGLIYDLLYTKAPIIYTKAGSILHAISFSSTVIVLVGFFLIIFMKDDLLKHYRSVDIAFTGVLLVGAFVLEMYAITVILSSEWTMLWLMKHHGQDKLVTQFFQKFPWLFSVHKRRSWSNSMGQFNLMSFCLRHKSPKLSRILSLITIEEMWDKYSHMTRVDIHEEKYLKEEIFQFIWSIQAPEEITGQKALQDHNCLEELQRFSIEDLDIRIIIWHSATELCLYDLDTASTNNEDTATINDERRTCKLLSDYMLYLLVISPSMLQITSSDLAFKHISKYIRDLTLGHEPDEHRVSEKLQTFPADCQYHPIMREGL